jgi:hemerythrin
MTINNINSKGFILLLSLFLTKNQKLVRKWTKEHEKIVLLINRVIAEYSKNNHAKAKKLLTALNNLVVDHVTDENIEFYKLLKDEKRLSPKNKHYTEEFIETFADVKKDLMKFLTKYTRKEVPLDDEFFETITAISEILLDRIQYEESKLYAILDISREEEKWERIKREI